MGDLFHPVLAGSLSVSDGYLEDLSVAESGAPRKDHSGGSLADDRFRIPERQLAADVSAHLWRGSGSQRDRCRRAKLFVDLLDAEIAGAEIVTPLADAMRFVDREERYSGSANPLRRLPVVEPLGRHVEEFYLAALRSCKAIRNLPRR